MSKPLALIALLLVPFTAFGQQPAAQTDPCVAKSEYELLLKKGVAGQAGPKPAQPVDAKNKPLVRAEVEAAIEAAEAAGNKAIDEFHADEANLAKANTALVQFDTEWRPKLSTLNNEALKLTDQIHKAREFASTIPHPARQALAEFTINEIDPLVKQVRSQMPNVPFDQARVSIGDYKDFDNAEIRKIKETIKALETSIKNTDAAHDGKSGSSIDLVGGDIKNGRQLALINQQNEELSKAIERARTSVRQQLKDYDAKQTEYAEKFKSLVPDAQTRQLVDNLAALETERSAKQTEIAAINENRRSLADARREAQRKIDGQKGISEGSEKRALDAQQKARDLEAQLERIDKYEKWDEADKNSKTLAAKKIAYDQAEAAKTKALAEAKQVVFDVRGKLNAERSVIRTNERPKFLNSASFLGDKAQLVTRLKGLDASQRPPLIRKFKEEQSAKLNAIVATMIQKAKDTQNLRLTNLLTSLSPYDCWKDVANYKNTILDAQKNASLVAGADFQFMDTEGWEEIPFEDATDGFPDVSGTWKASIGGITRTIRQTGAKISWSADYMWGPVKRHEDMQGTVSSSGGIEVIITYTAPGEPATKGGYSATASVDSNGKVTSIRWSNGDVYTRAP